MAGLTQIVGKERRPRRTGSRVELGLGTHGRWLQHGALRAPVALCQFQHPSVMAQAPAWLRSPDGAALAEVCRNVLEPKLSDQCLSGAVQSLGCNRARYRS